MNAIIAFLAGNWWRAGAVLLLALLAVQSMRLDSARGALAVERATHDATRQALGLARANRAALEQAIAEQAAGIERMAAHGKAAMERARQAERRADQARAATAGLRARLEADAAAPRGGEPMSPDQMEAWNALR